MPQGESSLSSASAPSPSAATTTLLRTVSFVYLGQHLDLDARDLARHLARYTDQHGGGPLAQDLKDAIAAACDTWWQQWEKQAGPLTLQQRREIADLKYELARGIESACEKPIPPAAPQKELSWLRERAKAIGRLARRGAQLLREPSLLAPQVTDDDGANALQRKVCLRFGLSSIQITGDAVMTPVQRRDLVLDLQRDLAESCRRLGIREHAFGDDGNTRIILFDDPRRNDTGSFIEALALPASGQANTAEPAPHQPPQRTMRPEIHCSHARARDPHRTLTHEWTHWLDAKLGTLARLLRGQRPTAQGVEAPLFTDLPPEDAARMPGVRRAIATLYSVLAEPGPNPGPAALAVLNDRLALAVLGGEAMLGMPASAYERVRGLLSSEDNALARAIVVARQNDPTGRDALVTAISTLPAPDVRDGYLVDALAQATGVPPALIADRLVDAVNNNMQQVRDAAQYVNDMAEVVDNPGPMIRAGGAALFAYANLRREVLARTVDRPVGFAEMFAARALDAPWTQQALTPEQVKLVNHNFALLLHEAGIPMNDAGPQLGFRAERVVNAVVEAALQMEDAAVRAKRFLAHAVASSGPKVARLISKLHH